MQFEVGPPLVIRMNDVPRRVPAVSRLEHHVTRFLE
jgi:hypothetical protein